MNLNSYVEYVGIEIDKTTEDIKKFCEVALSKRVGSIWINPCYVTVAYQELKDSNIEISTMINGLGTGTIATKKFEAENAIKDGADEIILPINIGAIKEKSYDYLVAEIEEVREAIKGKSLKILLDLNYLNEEELIETIKLCTLTYANYIYLTNSKGNVNIKDIELTLKEKSEITEVAVIDNSITMKDMEHLTEMGISKICISDNNKEVIL